MSGFWSIEQVNDYDRLWVDAESGSESVFSFKRETADGRLQVLNGITTILIWILPFVHLEEVTHEHASEGFIRVRMLEIARGPMREKPSDLRDEDVFLTMEDVSRHVGLRVGAGIPIRSFEETAIEWLRERA